jgi:catechol 2,3-dioxygenase-like lactoylglutathione lyase family enzyme
MLLTSPIIGFIPTTDPTRARAFYEHTLGLTFITDDGFALVFSSGANMIRIARAGDFTPAPFTILGWQVADIVAEVTTLTAAGVTFARYPFLPADQVDALGIWTSPTTNKVAWFQDPDGNTLSLSQHSPLKEPAQDNSR